MTMKFSVGQKTVYPAYGVGEIVSIQEKEISGQVHRFYQIRILSSDLLVLVPLHNAEKVGLRDLVSKEEIRDIYDILKTREEHKSGRQTWNRRYRGFMEKVGTGSLFEIAEVFRDLYLLKLTKTLSHGERRMLDTVRGLIVDELAIVKNESRDETERGIEKLFAV